MHNEQILEAKLLDLYYIYQRKIVNKKHGYFTRIIDQTSQSVDSISKYLSNINNTDDPVYKYQQDKADKLNA